MRSYAKTKKDIETLSTARGLGISHFTPDLAQHLADLENYIKEADIKVAAFLKEAEKNRGLVFKPEELPHVTAVIQENVGSLMSDIPRTATTVTMINGLIFFDIEKKLSEVFPGHVAPENAIKNHHALQATAAARLVGLFQQNEPRNEPTAPVQQPKVEPKTFCGC